MPELSSFTSPKPLTVSVDINGEPVEFAFDVNAVTPRWMESNLVDGLAAAGVSWNLTEDGQPLPLTKDNLERLPYPVLTQLTEKLIEASTPSSEEGNASSPSASGPQSDSGSMSPTSPNGSDTSTSPKPSESLSVT